MKKMWWWHTGWWGGGGAFWLGFQMTTQTFLVLGAVGSVKKYTVVLDLHSLPPLPVFRFTSLSSVIS